MPPQIAFNKQNGLDLYKRYFGRIAEFLTDIVGMDLDDWQRDVCDKLKEGENVRIAVSSGHSSGKSALMSGLNIYFITFHSQPKITVTANTENQLKNKTWRELAVWHQRCLIRDWFIWTATKFHMKGEAATWFASAVPWSEHKTEAFAGDHEKYMLLEYDEASSIPRGIFEVSEGATAKPGGFRWWLIFGNPTQSSGAFHERCFGRLKHRWQTVIIDTRSCRYADQDEIGKWIDDYGIDSDFVRVRVLGLPPKAALSGLISPEDVDKAMRTKLPLQAYRYAPKVLGVDCARYGDDNTVLCYRQGPKVHKFDSYNGLGELQIANKVAAAIETYAPQAVMMDVTGGYGIGAFNRLKTLGYNDIFPVVFSGEADEHPELFENKRFEIYENVRKWLSETKSDLPNDPDLEEELVAQELIYNKRTGKKQLLAKVDIKKLIGRSCDKSDSLAVSFAFFLHGDDQEDAKTEAEKDWLKVTGFGDDENSACNLMA